MRCLIPPLTPEAAKALLDAQTGRCTLRRRWRMWMAAAAERRRLPPLCSAATRTP